MEVHGGPEYVGRPAQMIGFPDAVKKAVLENYVNFSGRASRSEYWWFQLAVFILGIITAVLDGIIFGFEFDDPTVLSWIAQIGLFLPSLALVVRRLHDLGRSGWWFLIAFVPCIGIIVLFVFLVQDGQPHHNEYGEVPTNTL